MYIKKAPKMHKIIVSSKLKQMAPKLLKKFVKKQKCKKNGKRHMGCKVEGCYKMNVELEICHGMCSSPKSYLTFNFAIFAKISRNAIIF